MNEIEKMVPAQIIVLAKFCRVAMMILNARMFTLLGTLLAAGMFAWVLRDPDWIRFAGAVAFALLVFWPLQRMEANRNTQTQGDQNG